MTSLVPVGPRPGSERPVVLAWLAALAALCWAAVVFRAVPMAPSDIAALAHADLMTPPVQPPYRPDDLLLLFAMWTVMLSAMMLPAAIPAVLVFARVNRLYHAVRRPYLATALFVAGYLATWSGFGALATLAQWALHDVGALDPAMAVVHTAAAGLALVAAGAYQWTPAMHACLHHCRAPLAFVLTGWRPGWWGAFRMGFIHGFYCIGCCWLLTCLLFAAGVMNLAAIAGLAALILAEKLLPGGPWLACLAGLALVVWGTLLLFP
jgi:predicted metal-binding membrane protein